MSLSQPRHHLLSPLIPILQARGSKPDPTHMSPHCCPSLHKPCSVPRTQTWAGQRVQHKSTHSRPPRAPKLLSTPLQQHLECGDLKSTQDKPRKAQRGQEPSCPHLLPTQQHWDCHCSAHHLLYPHISLPVAATAPGGTQPSPGGNPRAESPPSSNRLWQGIQRQHEEEEGEAARG